MVSCCMHDVNRRDGSADCYMQVYIVLSILVRNNPHQREYSCSELSRCYKNNYVQDPFHYNSLIL